MDVGADEEEAGNELEADDFAMSDLPMSTASSASVSPPGQRFLRRVLSDRGAWGDDDVLDLDAVLADDDDAVTAGAGAGGSSSANGTRAFQSGDRASPGALTGTAGCVIPMPLPIAELQLDEDDEEEEELVDVDASIYGGK